MIPINTNNNNNNTKTIYIASQNIWLPRTNKEYYYYYKKGPRRRCFTKVTSDRKTWQRETSLIGSRNQLLYLKFVDCEIFNIVYPFVTDQKSIIGGFLVSDFTAADDNKILLDDAEGVQWEEKHPSDVKGSNLI